MAQVVVREEGGEASRSTVYLHAGGLGTTEVLTEVSAVLRSIIWVQAHEYELTFDVGGATLTCTCTVLAQDGVRLLQAVPDFLSTLGVSPR
ncbi:hypothetical protein WME98_10925 [Sorangium sp. So ce296]|uniref:hypothetical protein n=1 Tax=Sorangium sp. So ce296 TaxID=3133296 RepID=UPI003F633286